MPRSPRATMMPSLASRISSNLIERVEDGEVTWNKVTSEVVTAHRKFSWVLGLSSPSPGEPSVTSSCVYRGDGVFQIP